MAPGPRGSQANAGSTLMTILPNEAADPTAASSDPTTAPSDPTTAPSDLTAAPSDLTVAPSGFTAAPSDLAAAPSGLTAAASDARDVVLLPHQPGAAHSSISITSF